MAARIDKPTVLSTYFLNGMIPDQYAFSKFLYTSLTPQISNLGNVNGTVTVDASTGDLFRLTLTGAMVLANPINCIDGQAITWFIKQGAGGNFTITLGNKFVVPVSATTPLAWSITAGYTDVLAVRYSAADDKFLVLSMVPSYVL